VLTIGDRWPDRRVTTDNCWPDLGRPQNSDANEGNFNWLSGEPKLYSNWRPGEPNNAGENENCVVTRPDGFWNDVACDRGSVNPDGELCPQFDIAHACQQLMCDDGKADTIILAVAVLQTGPIRFARPRCLPRARRHAR
jgi:hypothetical protein